MAGPRWLVGLGAVTLLAACWHPEQVATPRYGQVMVEMGHRFELVGKSGGAGRYDLTLFELGEMEELLDEDLPRAKLPMVGGSANFAALTDDLRKTHMVQLRAAVKARDPKAFRAAFANVSSACNHCHQASGHAFIEIADDPAATVPRTDPAVAR